MTKRLRRRLVYLRSWKRSLERRLGPLARPFQFLFVGSTGMVVDLLCFRALLPVFPLSASRALAIWTAMTWNFWLNRRLTFSYAKNGSLLRQYSLFCLSCLFGGAVNWSVSVCLPAWFLVFAEWPLAAAVVGIVSGTAFNYIGSTYLAFGNCGPAPASKPLLESPSEPASSGCVP